MHKFGEVAIVEVGGRGGGGKQGAFFIHFNICSLLLSKRISSST